MWVLAQKLAEVWRDPLDDRVNGINLAIRRQNGVARKQIKNQQTFQPGLIRPVRQLFIAFAGHHFVQRGFSGSRAFRAFPSNI